MSLTVETIAAGLSRDYGIDPATARRKAEQIVANVTGVRTATEALPVAEVLAMPPIPMPIRLILPWSHLASDNTRHGAIASMRDGKPHAQLILTKEYRAAKTNIRKVATAALGGGATFEPANYPLALVARVWVPDEMRAHDVCNLAKVTHDSLEGVVYTKDRWLYDTRWIRAGVDVDAPRAELLITPYAT